MKLIRLKILQENSFRSLPKGFEIHFLTEFNKNRATDFNPYILAGRNGSGKSNILEVLAEIFYHLDCIYLENKPDYFLVDEEETLHKGFDPKKSRVNAYEIEYYTVPSKNIFMEIAGDNNNLAHIKIVKSEDDSPKIEWINQADFFEPRELSQKEKKSLLPEYVIGYASGDNEILSLPFFKSRFLQYDAYVNTVKNQQFEDPSPESSLVFLDSSFSQAILLTNLLMWENEEVLEPFKKYIGLTDVDTFRLIIRTDVKIDDEFDLLHNLDLSDTKDTPFSRSYLKKLKMCATCWFEYDENDLLPFNDVFLENKTPKKYLALDYKVNKATKEAFRFHFGEPIKLFELLQLLLILDIYSVDNSRKTNVYSTENIFLNQDINARPEEENCILRIKDFVIKKKEIEEGGIYTKALSDGEHQFLHTLGLSLLFKDTKSLFLLDEPETHFNPDWKAKFISSIRDAFSLEKEDSKKTIRDMLVTTHSPFLISDCTSDYVLIFKKGEKVKRPPFQTFGTSINKIGIRIFEMPNTVGEYAQERIKIFEEKINELSTKEDYENLITEINAQIGESVEKILLINKVLDKIEENK